MLENRLLLLTLLLLLLLLVSLAANLYLFRYGRSYVRLYNATRLDPLGLAVYSTGTPETAASQPRVVFFGDSRARQWTAPDTADFTFVNRGIDGQTSVQARMRFAHDVRPLRPDVVVVQVGVNDLFGIPYLPTQRETIIAEAQANISDIVAQARDLGARVVVTTVFPSGRFGLQELFSGSEGVRTAIAAVNDHIRTLAADDVVVLETAAVLTDEEGWVRDAYCRDAWHLNEAGYAALNRALLPLLQAPDSP